MMIKTFALPVAMSVLLTVLGIATGHAEAQESQPSSSSATTQPAASAALPQIPDRSFDVKAYGAAGDGTKDDAPAIQAAVKAATAAGGGTVVVPAGTFLSGPITLDNNIDLHLAEGAVLRMLPFGSYPEPNGGEYEPLIHAHGHHDVAISGSGTIDGQGQAWWDKYRSGSLELRPEMIAMFRITRLAIQGVRVQNAPKAHIDIGKGEDVTLDGVTIATPADSPNTDGIDVWGTNIVIKNCSIADGDDNIALSGNTSNVVITNCTFGHGHGVSIGGSTKGGLSNMIVDNCRFDGTESGVRGKSNRDRGGIVQNLVYSNLTMTNVKYPIYFHSTYEQGVKQPEQTTTQPATGLTPVWKNVTFANITATVADKYGAGIIWGLPEAPIENFTFKNVNITAYKGFKIYFAKGIVFSDDSRINITGTSKPLLLYEAQVQTQGNMEEKLLDANQAK
jgi:polygalacturonase